MTLPDAIRAGAARLAFSDHVHLSDSVEGGHGCTLACAFAEIPDPVRARAQDEVIRKRPDLADVGARSLEYHVLTELWPELNRKVHVGSMRVQDAMTPWTYRPQGRDLMALIWFLNRIGPMYEDPDKDDPRVVIANWIDRLGQVNLLTLSDPQIA
jgi:hypothetical protein